MARSSPASGSCWHRDEEEQEKRKQNADPPPDLAPFQMIHGGWRVRMTYDEVLAQVLELLRRDKRVAYRVLKRRFALDDEYVEDLKADLIKAKRLANDEHGEVLVWVGGPATTSAPSSTSPQSPRTYTPSHLAEQILAEQAAMATRGITEGERKTITALFADLKGSTALIEGLDPEEARALID